MFWPWFIARGCFLQINQKIELTVAMNRKTKYQIILAFIIILFALSCAGGGKMAKGSSDGWTPGDTVEVVGKISDMPWQHLVGMHEAYPYFYYIDIEGGGQIVAYSAKEIACEGRIKLRGKVIEAGGSSKRPGSDEEYRELQLLVRSFECLE